jgi:hypothetical protein
MGDPLPNSRVRRYRQIMSPEARHDHTARLLAGRLEEIARASEGPRGAQRVETRVLAALAATRHAIQLGLLSSDEADAIWASVAERHPNWHATSRPQADSAEPVRPAKPPVPKFAA